MMDQATLRLVLWVSCAHALVHVYEISLPAVEQAIAREYSPHDTQAGKRLTGMISTSWRLTWGFGALLAGWLVDRYGSRLMLTVYLLGSSGMCWLAASASWRWSLVAAMVAMGALASIYHPAGLALISHSTTLKSRPRALGLHGVLGSAGIGLTPLIVGQCFFWGLDWRGYYFLLGIPGIPLGYLFFRQAMALRNQTTTSTRLPEDDTQQTRWPAFLNLVSIAVLQGFVYSAMVSFLPRYLSAAFTTSSTREGEVLGNAWAGPALLIGCAGQFLAGWWAKSDRLEKQFALITFGNAVPLAWMAVAQGWQRPAAAGLFALVHFMHQPIYNSLISKYTAASQRSRCYGFSFAMGLGLGGVGALFNGLSNSDFFTYAVLAGVAFCAGLGCLALIAQGDKVTG